MRMADKKSDETTTNNEKIIKQIIEDEEVLQTDRDKAGGKKNKVIDLCPYPSNTILKCLHENEDGDAKLLIAECQGKFCYDHSNQNWYYWNDHYWRLDKINNIFRSVEKVIEIYGTEKNRQSFRMSKTTKDEEKKRCDNNIKLLSARMKELRTSRRKKNILTIAKAGVDSLGIPGENWDRQKMILGCKNGMVDLKTGELLPGEPDMLIRSVSPVKWVDINESCPAWEKFISEIFSNDEELIKYVQRLLGYGITGSVKEHVIPILWGEYGRNGKGTLIETLKYVLGSLAFKAPNDFLLETKHKNSTGPDASVMALMGKRVIWCSETNKGARIDAAKLKELVGGDTISARPPYGKFQIEFKPTHLLLLLTNRKPQAPAEDTALWKRIHLIPFKWSFSTEPDPTKMWELPCDLDLPEKLKKEASGIIAWLVRGCMEWQKKGLKPPDVVTEATNEYRKEEDILGHFVEDYCVMYSGAKVQSTPFYRAYEHWCKNNGHKPISHTKFGREMKKRFQKETNPIVIYLGVDILEEYKILGKNHLNPL